MKPTIPRAMLLSALVSLAGGAHAAAPVPSTGGLLPSGLHSDQVSWQHFVDIVTPVSSTQAVFETWATDKDMYTATPVWPTPEAAARKHLRPSLLQHNKAPHALATSAALDSECGPVGDAAAGNFPQNAKGQPVPGPIALPAPQPCFAEEVRRNRPTFDYIVANGLHTTAGLAQAYKKAKAPKSTWRVALPTESIEVKIDWIPVETLVDWLAANHARTSLEEVKKQYYTTVSKGVTYGAVSMHLSSKEIPNWVWATFEHQNNPGRCDTMGCRDSFGAVKAVVPAAAKANGQYGACAKAPALETMFKAAGLGPAWNHYCLKGSQIDFVAKNKAPLMLGDSFTERVAASVPINHSSCIACHASAAVTSKGLPYTTMLNKHPMGNVTLPPDALAVDFIWGILFTEQ
jgi:hypothetical protein